MYIFYLLQERGRGTVKVPRTLAHITSKFIPEKEVSRKTIGILFFKSNN